MYKIANVMEILEQLAPLELAEEWDNVGILVGNPLEAVTKIMCALDLNKHILDEAISAHVDCIITHHPFIFQGIKKIDYMNPVGQIIRELIKNNITLIAMHTNLDKAEGGINDIICKELGIEIKDKDNFLRWGEIVPNTLTEIIAKVKHYFNIPFIRVIGDTEHKIDYKRFKNVSVCSGSGASFIKQAAQVSDIYITADLKFHEAQEAISLGLVVLDIGHYNSEKIIVPYLVNYLKNRLNIDVISTNICAEVFKTL